MKNQLLVRDSSATAEAPKREHDVMVNGAIQRVTFEYGKPTPLPYEVAIKFMQDGFTVSNDAGEEMHRPAKTDETVRIRINSDEIVANYSELTVNALIMRAALLPGGEKFVAGKDKRDDIVAFLKAAAAPAIEVEDDEPEQQPEIKVEEKPEPENLEEIRKLAAAGEPLVNISKQPELVWAPVAGSSQVNGFAYDGVNQRLYIEYKGEGFPVWAYEGVSPEKFQGFQAAESKGSFVANQIKKAAHKGTQMKKADFLQPQQPDAATGLPSAEPPDEV